jgi:thymidylate synthase
MHAFLTAQRAFEYYYDLILQFGTDLSGTKVLYNVGFTILNPEENSILTTWRKWSKKYADIEWGWYLSKERSIKEISKHAKIWLSCADMFGNVNSNYGYQWNRRNQLDKVVELLKHDINTRKASISLYDGKEIYKYSRDTVCTYAISFNIYDSRLHMTVMMRSNDLVFGFCNDQYCFSKLLSLVHNKLLDKYPDLRIGTYTHFVVNMHIYSRHFNLKDNKI